MFTYHDIFFEHLKTFYYNMFYKIQLIHNLMIDYALSTQYSNNSQSSITIFSKICQKWYVNTLQYNYFYIFFVEFFFFFLGGNLKKLQVYHFNRKNIFNMVNLGFYI